MGGHNERTNLQIVDEICAFLDELRPWPGHRYAIDPAKIKRDLGWEPEVGFTEGIRRTIKWYLEEGQGLLRQGA